MGEEDLFEERGGGWEEEVEVVDEVCERLILVIYHL